MIDALGECQDCASTIFAYMNAASEAFLRIPIVNATRANMLQQTPRILGTSGPETTVTLFEFNVLCRTGIERLRWVHLC
jgi:hypothetical protein